MRYVREVNATVFSSALMDSSQLVGGAEECSSSESGWTMYLASPMHGQTLMEDDEGQSSEDDDGDRCVGGSGGEDGDSLASDASSGPPHRCLSNLNGSFGGTPIPNEDRSEEEDDVDGPRAEMYVSRKSLKGKKKKGDDGDASVSNAAEGGGDVFLGSDRLAKK